MAEVSARERALKAHEERLAATAPVAQPETFQDREDRERRERERMAYELLPQSPVVEWFPGVEWTVIDHGRPGTSDQYRGSGYDFYVAPPERDFTLWVGKHHKTGAWEVQFVWRHKATGAYEHEGTYWTGVEVRSAADVGAALAKREERS